MATTVTTTTPLNPFTAAEWNSLRRLRRRYRQQRDLFSTGELARLRFLRWLYRSGRLSP